MRLCKKNKIPEVDAGATTNIAFLTLLFFIVLCSVNSDTGIARRLPPMITIQNKPTIISARNLMAVYITSGDELYCDRKLLGFGELRARAKLFIQNPNNDSSLPEKEPLKILSIGIQQVTTKHVISVQCERGTKYQAYMDVQNELNAAYNELRNELAEKKWGHNFAELDEAQQIAVCQCYPIHISEAEPIGKGGGL